MRSFSILGGIALAGVSAALTDSSPWVLISTSKFDTAPNPSQIQTAAEALKYTKDYLTACPADRYLVVSQPGARAVDIRRTSACPVPHLCEAVEDNRVKAVYTVAEVVGKVEKPEFSKHIKSACAAKNKDVTVEEVILSPVSAETREGDLKENDNTLAQSLRAATGGNSYAIVYFSTPAEPTYESDFDESVRMELKRNAPNSNMRRKDNNSTDWEKLPLFKKYQFFTPGIFMALITVVLLFSILGVGLRALSSLEVSYGAFEKEMGPAAQKKTQ